MTVMKIGNGCAFNRDHGEEPAASGYTRRQTLDMLAAGGLWAAFGTALGGYPNPASAAEDDVVRPGYLPITDATALLIAYAKGYFKDEGLDAEKPTLIRSWPALVESFAAAKFNIVHLLKPIPVWMRYNNKFPTKIMAWGHTNGSGLVGPLLLLRSGRQATGCAFLVFDAQYRAADRPALGRTHPGHQG